LVLGGVKFEQLWKQSDSDINGNFWDVGNESSEHDLREEDLA
jgi:hypothetical protein